MLSDESSSDSETGRFKGRSKEQKEQNSNQRQDNSRQLGRGRPSDDRFRRDLDRRRDDRDRFDRHSRERQRSSRHQSPVRRRHSRERSPPRRSRERHRYNRDSRPGSKPREHRSASRDRRKRSTSQKPPEQKKDREEIRLSLGSRAKSPIILDRKPMEQSPESPEPKGKRSEIHKPKPIEVKRKSDSPIIVVEHDSDASAEVQPGSYYNMIPAVVKEKSDESSEIDSSDDERLRAKLLNLEKELHKTKRKKHKKKHKKRNSKNRDKNDEVSTSVEVSSTTDIQDKVTNEVASSQPEAAEVTSTQKNVQKDSSEEGEISSDNDSQDQYDIDPTDLRHKLRRGKRDSSQDTTKSNVDVCGPALPPHLKTRFSKSVSPDIEGPVLPPHLQRKVKIGPAIPEDMRKVLADSDRTVIKYVSSDEDGIGPLPVGAEDKWSDAHQRLEERALDIKIKKLDGHSLNSREVKSREQWMLELPEGKAKYLGLEARGFRPKEGPDMSDRSSWTDTPEDKARKAAGLEKPEDADAALKRETQARIIADRDEEQETAVKKHKKKHKREESLLEMHEKKLKKKKKKEERADGKKERRPFSRDVDLQVNRFDEAQKKSIIKKAEGLNTRFSSGEAKFL